MTLEDETERLNQLFAGSQVKRAVRLKDSELMIDFTDGMRLYVNAQGNKLDLSVVDEGVAK